MLLLLLLLAVGRGGDRVLVWEVRGGRGEHDERADCRCFWLCVRSRVGEERMDVREQTGGREKSLSHPLLPSWLSLSKRVRPAEAAGRSSARGLAKAASKAEGLN